jgi:phage shock protein A
MNLETRVDTLERDVALLRTETRGWAEIAVAASRKSDMNAELLNLVYREVLETKRDVQEMKATLVPDVAALKTDVGALKTDVAVLKTDVAVLKTDVAAHGEILREHGEMLREILARLA